MARTNIGGSFAPPLSDEALAKYEALADTAEPEIKDAMLKLLACVRKWWELPESTGNARTPHASGTGMILPLDDAIAKELWESIPWAREIKMIQDLFDGISNTTHRQLRDAAFHLLWHVKELDLDREPITADRI